MQNKVHLLVFQWRRMVEEAGGVDNGLHGHRESISCSLQLSNKTENHVAFKVKTTNPKKYCVRPNTGPVLPRSTCDVTGVFPSWV
ncbi:putative major sperm protein (MSP) [Helianthus annuus]|nr:putative major sperm protein (MSP) [Helianthus annuus]